MPQETHEDQRTAGSVSVSGDHDLQAWGTHPYLLSNLLGLYFCCCWQSLTEWPKLTSNSQLAHLRLPSAGIIS